MEKRTLWAVGHGGQGWWKIDHFDSLEKAQAFAAAEIEVNRGIYRQGGKFQESTRPAVNMEVSHWSIVNVKRDGKPGKLRQSVQVLTFQGPCDYWGCTCCRGIEASSK